MMNFPDYPMTDEQRFEYERLRAEVFAADERYRTAEADFARALAAMNDYGLRESKAATPAVAEAVFDEIANEANKVSWALLHDEY